MKKFSMKGAMLFIAILLLIISILTSIYHCRYCIKNPYLHLTTKISNYFLDESITFLDTIQIDDTLIVFWKSSNQLCGIAVYKEGINSKYNFCKIDCSKSANNLNQLFTAIADVNGKLSYITYGEFNEQIRNIITSSNKLNLSKNTSCILLLDNTLPQIQNIQCFNTYGKRISINVTEEKEKIVIQPEFHLFS